MNFIKLEKNRQKLLLSLKKLSFKVGYFKKYPFLLISKYEFLQIVINPLIFNKISSEMFKNHKKFHVV